jgi:hypothetical protein
MTAWLAQPGRDRESSAWGPAGAADGVGSDLPQAAAQPARSGPGDLPGSRARGEGKPEQPGLARGYHLRTPGSRVCVSGGGDRLV